MADTDREYRKAFYRALNVHQGTEEEFERYYVPIYDQPDGPAGPDLLKDMATAIEFTTGGSVQLLAGYRGAGKTTELLRLCRVLDRDAYVPVYWDIEDYFNTELPLEEGAFLVGLAAGFVDNCEGAGIPREKLIDQIRRLLNRIEVDSGAALNASAGPVSVDIKVALQDDTSFRNQVKKALSSNRRRFKEEIHAFFNAMVDAMSRCASATAPIAGRALICCAKCWSNALRTGIRNGSWEIILIESSAPLEGCSVTSSVWCPHSCSRTVDFP